MKLTKIFTFSSGRGTQNSDTIWATEPDCDGFVQYILESFYEGHSTPYGEGGDVKPNYRYTLLDLDHQSEVRPELLAFVKSLMKDSGDQASCT